MLEVVFGASIAGSMAMVMGRTEPIGGAISVVLMGADGHGPSKREIRAAQRVAEERERRNWANAIPLEGSRKDMISFPLPFSVGPIEEAGIGERQKEALLALCPEMAEEEAAQIIQEAQDSLRLLLERAAGGEPVRVWCSQSPDEACGLCWLAEQLRPLGFERLEIRLVRLPPYEEEADGTVAEYGSWGEVEPHRLGRMAQGSERASAPLLRVMAERWRQLRQEGSTLRAVLNGQLVGVPESLYDPYILREIDAQSGTFREAVVIGNVLGKYRLGIGDGWIALRIEEFIQAGLLEPVTQAEPPGSYRRILHKRRRGSR